MARKAVCSVGYGGAPISGWRFDWLPKGYGPTTDDRLVCVVADPDDEDWHEGFTFSDPHPLIAAIRDAITEYYESRQDDK